MLLEVLVAMALFVSAAAVVGSAMFSAAAAVEDLRLETEATNLAQSVFTDLAAGRIELADTEPTTYDLDTTTAEDDSDKGFPWTYQIVTEDLSDATNLLRVTVIVRSTDPSIRQSCKLTQWMLAPALEGAPEEGYDEGFEEEGL